jgi:two-component system chemotaxis sensor kinase CheA
VGNFETEILFVFLDESTEALLTYEKSCLLIGESGTSDAEAIAQLFRCAHNMKGSAKSVGFAALGDFLHILEDLILKLKSGVVAASQSIVHLLLECHSCLGSWLKGLRTDPAFVVSTQLLVSRLQKAALEGHTASEKSADEMQNSVYPDDKLTIRNESGDIVFIQFSETGDSGVFTPPSAPVQRTHEPVKNASASSKNVNETIRVSAGRIDRLIQLAGEISIQSAIISHARQVDTLHSGVALDAISLLTKLTRELQSEALGFRLQTVQGTMQRLERVAHDVSRELGKEVEIVIAGIDVELDKTVLERMTDPLVHMVRNALDHGIETREERQKTSKPAKAKLILEAFQAPDGVTLIIGDDGRGMNPQKIRAKAEELGLVSKDQKMTDQEIYSFIFHQGFSTADKVTGISGRGVGMEVVQRAIKELGGNISIESNLGLGTSFSVNLPSSVSIIDALLVQISHNRYAVPLSQIEEVISPQDIIVEQALDHQAMFQLRSKNIPLHDLRVYMRSKQRHKANSPHKLPNVGESSILVVRHQEQRLGLTVDKISGQQQIVVRKLSGILESLDGFVGGTILGNGEPGFILDIPFLAASYFKSHKGAA